MTENTFTPAEISSRLSQVARFDEVTRNYQTGVVSDTYGEYVRFDDILELFGLTEHYSKGIVVK